MTTLRGWLVQRLWYVHPVTTLTVKALPNDCLRALALATRPNLDRLHLRNLFTDGRRYYIHALKDGFQMTSDTPVPWRRRARASVAAILRGSFSASGNDSTIIRLKTRMRLLYFLDIFPIPFFISSILVFTPWSRVLVAVLTTTLFFLSWMGHRLTATLQAADMIYFVQTVLDEVTTTDTQLLGSSTSNVVTPEQDFPEQWQKFYEEHKRD